ncbi:hypothetical protein BU25DRAFT_456621 [Macroventuria anomochaeta]|uniref:Uncharacterized protein n=1 Tax=Macroventuria anomochaeta TaxID=301207 RepID=A0ACB6S5J4_9PLEO|nr:uncharacterized protein BU25DRAFT_456621 [Macroventuria anomochaeta]KAF2629526.1 hypothetical protein BU25DRAFT_456621 [Macroventuria anomochaeta]
MATLRNSFTTAPKPRQRNDEPKAVAVIPGRPRPSTHTIIWVVPPEGDDAEAASTSEASSSTSDDGESADANSHTASSNSAPSSPVDTLSTSSLTQEDNTAEVQEMRVEGPNEGKKKDKKKDQKISRSATRAELLKEMDEVRVKRLGKEPYSSPFLSWKAC